tara:strand:+ start:20 stop:127 length:108 start_codon:yes stop_codon:yes gene_type:complete
MKLKSKKIHDILIKIIQTIKLVKNINNKLKWKKEK